MKRLAPWFTSTCIVVCSLLTGCSTSHSVSGSTASSKITRPHFINDIALGGNGNNISMKVVDRSKEMARIQPSQSNTLQTKYAGMLGVLPQAITNFSLYNFIDEWYGVAYRYGGDDKTGIDCSAFVQRLYEQVFGVNLVRTALEQFRNCTMVWKNSDSLKEGDLVFFHIHSRHITHVGIYLMNNFFVHASVSQGVMISSLTDEYWQKYFAGAGAIQKDNNG